MNISVFNYTGRYAITFEQGKEIYQLIYPYLKSNKIINLDFSKVILFSSVFMNPCIGLLYKDFSASHINKYLQISNLENKWEKHFELIKTNSEKYYTDVIHKAAVDKVIEELLNENLE